APGVAVDEEMVESVQLYLDYCRALPGQHYVEVRLDYSNYVPEGFGTADFVAYDEASSTLHVVDLKYGKGVRIDAEENEQGMLYGVGALNNLAWLGDVETVSLVIVQPRLDHVSEWQTTPAHLFDFVEKAKAAAESALSDNPAFCAGEK